MQLHELLELFQAPIQGAQRDAGVGRWAVTVGDVPQSPQRPPGLGMVGFELVTELEKRPRSPFEAHQFPRGRSAERARAPRGDLRPDFGGEPLQLVENYGEHTPLRIAVALNLDRHPKQAGQFLTQRLVERLDDVSGQVREGRMVQSWRAGEEGYASACAIRGRQLIERQLPFTAELAKPAPAIATEVDTQALKDPDGPGNSDAISPTMVSGETIIA